MREWIIKLTIFDFEDMDEACDLRNVLMDTIEGMGYPAASSVILEVDETREE